MTESDPTHLRVVRRLSEASRRATQGATLTESLVVLAEGIVDDLSFDAATFRLRREGTDELVVHRGTPQPADLLFSDESDASTPDDVVAYGPFRWDADNHRLVADIRAGGDIVLGLLAAVPAGTELPDETARELLEIFVVHAAGLVGQDDLVGRLRAEHGGVLREQARSRANEAAFRFAFEGSAGAMAIASLRPDRVGDLLQVNRAFSALTGLRDGDPEDRNWLDLVHPDDRAVGWKALRALSGSGTNDHQRELRLARADGTQRWVTATVTVVSGEGEPFLLMHVDDIDERKRREQELEHHAHHDFLTGLANRRAILGQLDDVLARSGPVADSGVVLFVDVDEFKSVNDAFGHHVGDDALREIAARLRASVRPRDLVGRLGGDEFVVVARDVDLADGRRLADRIRAAVDVPVRGCPRPVTVSIGVATLDSGRSALEVVAAADRAMFADKAQRSVTVRGTTGRHR